MPNEDQTGEILSSQSCNGTLVGLVHEAWDCKGCLTRARAKVSVESDNGHEPVNTLDYLDSSVKSRIWNEREEYEISLSPLPRLVVTSGLIPKLPREDF